MTISEAFALYDLDVLRNLADRTRRNYRSTMASLLKHVGDIPIELLTYEHCIRWKYEREHNGLAPASIAADLSNLRMLLKYLSRHHYKVLSADEIELPKLKPKEAVWLDIDEISRILAVIESPRDKAIFACLFGSGARISELLSLRRDSIVNGEAKIIGKGSKEGVLRFDLNALKYLDAYLATRKDKLTPLFISGQNRCITSARVLQLCHQYADWAGIEKNVTTHIYRHSFASDLKMNGADIFDIQKQLRHSSISTTLIYTHINDKKRKDDYNKFHTSVPLV